MATVLILIFILGRRSKCEYDLGYDIVMKLMQPLINQGCHIFFDNFYTSIELVNDLFNPNTPSCGMVTENRKGFQIP